MPKQKRSLVAAIGALAACALIAIGASAAGAAGAGAGAATAGKHTTGVLYTAITRTVNGTEYLAGVSSDKVLGQGAATYTSTVGPGTKPGTLKVLATVIIFTRTGSLVGKATSTLTINADNSVTFTNGKIKAAKGQGGQAGHTFVATFTGTGKSISGPFTFHYTGTYK